MRYLISFLEGVVTFISPCMLPMLPIYIAYFSAGGGSRGTTVINSCGFVLGFSAVFISLGAVFSSLGALLSDYAVLINLIAGLIVVIFGLNFLGIIRLTFLERSLAPKNHFSPSGFFSAIVFGVIFAISYTPCVGTFLGSALLLASSQSSFFTGVTLLICYCLGLGLPFILCSALLDSLKSTLELIKRHYGTINKICGVLLIIVGLFMMTGRLSSLISLLS